MTIVYTDFFFFLIYFSIFFYFILELVLVTEKCKRCVYVSLEYTKDFFFFFVIPMMLLETMTKRKQTRMCVQVCPRPTHVCQLCLRLNAMNWRDCSQQLCRAWAKRSITKCSQSFVFPRTIICSIHRVWTKRSWFQNTWIPLALLPIGIRLSRGPGLRAGMACLFS